MSQVKGGTRSRFPRSSIPIRRRSGRKNRHRIPGERISSRRWNDQGIRFWMHMKGKMEQGELFEQIDHRSSIADALLEEPCTDPYARFCERTAGCGPPPTRSLKVLRHADSARSSWMKTIHVGPSAQPDADRQRSFRPSISTQPYRHRRGLPPTTRRSRAL